MGRFMLGATDQSVVPKNEWRRLAVPAPFAKPEGVPSDHWLSCNFAREVEYGVLL
jgi:hypothetical protein